VQSSMLEEARGKTERAEAAQAEAEAARNRLEEEYRKAGEELDGLRSGHAEALSLKVDLEGSRAAKRLLEARVEEVEVEAGRLREEIAELQSQLRGLPTLQGRADALADLVARKDGEVKEATDDAKRCKEEGDAAKRRAAGLTYDLDKATDRIRSLAAENQRLKKIAGVVDSPTSQSF